MLGAASLAAQTARLPSVSLDGRDSVRVTDLAKAHGMNVSASGRFVTLRSPSDSLVLEVDNREATLHGVKVWLNSAPTASRGKTLIGRMDVAKVIEPILAPSRNRSPAPVRTIVIDPGHGGRDQGGRSASGILEKTVALDVAKRLRQILVQKELTVTLTRESDSTVSLDRRVRLANKRRADLFVSLHFNAEPRGRTARGIETYCLTPAGAASTATARALVATLDGNRFDTRNMLLAFQVQRNLLSKTDAADRGIRRARFFLLRYAECPAILVEGGFLTHASEAKLLATTAYRVRIVTGIAEGILAYKRVLER